MWIEEIYVTDLGKALLAKTPAGVPVPVTRWRIGQGVLPAAQGPGKQIQL